MSTSGERTAMSTETEKYSDEHREHWSLHHLPLHDTTSVEIKEVLSTSDPVQRMSKSLHTPSHLRKLLRKSLHHSSLSEEEEESSSSSEESTSSSSSKSLSSQVTAVESFTSEPSAALAIEQDTLTDVNSVTSNHSIVNNNQEEVCEEEKQEESHKHNTLRRHNLKELLQSLPRSPKELIAQMTHQQTCIRRLENENTQLRAREVEVASLAIKLQEHFASTQSQVDNIKAQIHLQLAHPVTEKEYAALEAKPEHKRDLLDTVKLGIYRQLAIMKGSCDAATRKSVETENAMAHLQDELMHVKYKLKEEERLRNLEKEEAERVIQNLTSQVKHHSQLELTVTDLEQKLRTSNVQQEEFLTAKLNAQIKTDEVAKLGIRLEEAEMEIAKYKSNYECSEQKLDILKNEFYELKLSYSQRVHELETALRASDDKLRALNELELESELFISNLAQQSINEEHKYHISNHDLNMLSNIEPLPSAYSLNVKSPNEEMKYREWLALPTSRKMSHALTITKRCLHLENIVSSLQHEVKYKEKQIERLQLSLETAREALNNSNNPYSLIEKTVNELSVENDRLHSKVNELSSYNEVLLEKLNQRTADVHVLCKHRKQLIKMKKALQQLGLNVPASSFDYEDKYDKEESNDVHDKHEKLQQQQQYSSNTRESSNGKANKTAGEVVTENKYCNNNNNNNGVDDISKDDHQRHDRDRNGMNAQVTSSFAMSIKGTPRSAYYYMPMQPIEIRS